MELWQIFSSLNAVEITLFLLGFVLLIIEMLHPGFGAAGGGGMILIFTGILLTSNSFEEGLLLAAVMLGIASVLMVVLFFSVTKGRLSRRLILKESANREAGFTGVEDMQYLLHKSGVAVTPLRPAGCVDFDGVRLDVVTQGDFIEKGCCVTVILVEGNRIVVAEAK